MIVQNAASGITDGPDGARFVITMADHTAVAGQLAAAFGNDTFTAPQPANHFIELAAHHDAGWAALDAKVLRDPATGLPYHLTSTPSAEMIPTATASPDANEARHRWSGLLSSMHSTGLYNGRFGTSTPVFPDLVPVEMHSAVEAVLAQEEQRRQRLTSELAADPTTAEWVTDEAVWHAYFCLQFFDSAALWLQSVAPPERTTATFRNVPTGPGSQRVQITITGIDEGTAAVSPWPFSNPKVTVTTRGRWMHPVPDGDNVADSFQATEPSHQTTTLIPG